jgi:hypothetical protein
MLLDMGDADFKLEAFVHRMLSLQPDPRQL